VSSVLLTLWREEGEGRVGGGSIGIGIGCNYIALPHLYTQPSTSCATAKMNACVQ